MAVLPYPHSTRSRVQTALRAALVLALLAALGSPAGAQPPPGYYDSVDTTSAQTLRTTLHEVIDDHVRFPYTSSSTDTWDILELADEDPNDPSNILDLYLNASYPKAGGGNDNYNREHTWPNSYGFPDDGSDNYPYTDTHALFLADSGYNSSRGNNPYRFCDATCTEKPTVFNDGRGGGEGFYPGNSSWRTGSGSSGSWETWIGRRGDVARALFYLDVRYEGGTHGGTGFAEPDLILTDNPALIQTSGGVNASVAYMGMLSVLRTWHVQDPVDDRERERNDVIFGFQGNRNPFIDHPEWVNQLFPPQPCEDTDTALCLNDSRFRISASFETPQGQSGMARVVRLTDDTGYFWFFDQDNVELVVKVLDACTTFDRFWVFAAGLTNVEVQLTVEDTANPGVMRSYENPQGQAFAPVQDTNAFATCGGDGVAPLNEPPVASFESSCRFGCRCEFEDTSVDPDGFIAERSWSFGDGASSSGAEPSYQYRRPGTYEVTLEVTDDDGVTDLETRSVQASGRARSSCCKICTSSQACGDSCISSSFNCHQPPGCACDSFEVCR
jgi:endonuclease I